MMHIKIALRHVTGAALGVVLAVLLSGCFKIDMDMTVNSDDTVDGAFIVGVDRSLADVIQMSEEELRQELEQDLTADLPEGSRAEPYSDDRFIGTRITLDNVPLDELNEGSSTGDLSITREGDTYVVSGQLNLTEDEFGTTGLEGLEGIAGNVETQVRLTFPGEITETNGELSNENRTVTWNPQPGEVNEIMAVAEAEGSGDGGGVPGWLWPLVGIGAIAAAGLVFLNMRNRQPPAQPIEPARDSEDTLVDPDVHEERPPRDDER